MPPGLNERLHRVQAHLPHPFDRVFGACRQRRNRERVAFVAQPFAVLSGKQTWNQARGAEVPSDSQSRPAPFIPQCSLPGSPALLVAQPKDTARE